MAPDPRSSFAILCAAALLQAPQATRAQPGLSQDDALRPASARETDGPSASDLAPPPEAARKITDTTVTAGDVAATPVDDFNLRDRKQPELLLELQKDPYASAGLESCEDILAAIAPLEDLLGEDLDTAAARKHPITAGAVGKEVVGMLIPFRGLIREASGANASRRRKADLVIVGMMRRAYLKGLGQQRGCPYPARPADEETLAVLAALAPEPVVPAPSKQPRSKSRYADASSRSVPEQNQSSFPPGPSADSR